MELSTVWFILIAVLFTGYFVLEGFDFGIGMLLPVLARDNRERRVLINTIGPVWDGNEVWVLTAGGAMFAAFPEWYATLLSGFYLPLLLILVALIIRGVAFEYRGKRADARWQQRWDWCIITGSAVPALLWGVAVANIIRGVPLNFAHEYTGTLSMLLNPYALLGGLTTVTLFATHGAVFAALKTEGDIRARANRLAFKLGLGAAALAVAFLTGWGVAKLRHHRFCSGPPTRMTTASSCWAYITGSATCRPLRAAVNDSSHTWRSASRRNHATCNTQRVAVFHAFSGLAAGLRRVASVSTTSSLTAQLSRCPGCGKPR